MEIDAPEVDAPIDAQDTTPEPTLRETLVAARDEILARDDAPARDRDEAGRFKAKDGEVAPDVAAAPVETPPEAAAEPETPPAPVEPAPASWSADAKAKWADVPAEVRAEFAKRETEVRQMAGRMDGERQFGRAVNEVVSPYLPMMKAGNLHPTQVIGDLLNTAYIFNTGDAEKKARTLALVADQYGIDLDAAYKFKGQGQPVSAIQAPPQPAPDINAQVEAAIAQRELARETETFFADPKNVHAAAVRDHMAALLGGGVATTLQDAYDQAVYARPDLRSTLIAQERSKWEAQQAELQRTAQAKRAAVSLPGSSGSPRPTGTHETSLRDELRNKLREMTSAA